MNASNKNDDDHDDPDRKTRLKENLDEFVSEEKSMLAGNGEADGLELQDRLDHFMNRLQQRMEPFTQEGSQEAGKPAPVAQANVAETETSKGLVAGDHLSHLEEVSEEAAEDRAVASTENEAQSVDEALACLSHLEEESEQTVGDVEESAVESAADKSKLADEEFGVYKIRGLDVPDSPSQEAPYQRSAQIAGAVVVALLMAWAVWPSGEKTPVVVEKPIVEKSVSKKSVIGKPIVKMPVAEKPVVAKKAKIEPAIVAKKVVVPVKGEKMTVTVSIGNVREKPGASAKVLFKLRKGDVVTRLKSKRGWYQIVTSDGRKAWAYESLFIESETQQKEASKNTDAKVVSAPTVEPEPATEPVPTAEAESAVESVPAAEPVPTAEVEQAVESVPVTEPVPTAEVESAAESVPAAEPVPGTESTPAVESVPATELAPKEVEQP